MEGQPLRRQDRVHAGGAGGAADTAGRRRRGRAAPVDPAAPPAGLLRRRRRTDTAGWTKEITGLPVIAVGSVGLATAFKPGKRDGDPIAPAPVDRLLEQFDAGEFDLIAIGRALLADPAWVNRLRDDALDGFGGYHADSALASLH